MAVPDRGAGFHIEGGEQRRGAVPDVVMRAALWLTGTHGERRRSIERLNLALLIDAQHQGAIRRMRRAAAQRLSGTRGARISLQRLLTEYVAYYLRSRTHPGLDKDAPISRAVMPRSAGRVAAIPHVGGVHHRYQREAA